VHAERVKTHKAQAAKAAIPDSTVEEGDDDQRATCPAIRAQAPVTSFATGSRFVISFSDSNDKPDS